MRNALEENEVYYDTLQDANESLHSQLKDLLDERQEKMKENDNLLIKISRIEREREETKMTLAGVTFDIQESLNSNTELKEKLQIQDLEIEKLRLECKILEEQTSESVEGLQEAVKQLEGRTTEIDNLQLLLSLKESENAQLSTKCREAEDEVKAGKKRILDLAGSISALRDKVGTKQYQIDELKIEHQETVRTREEALNDLKGRLEEAENEVKEVSTICDKM